MSKKLLVVPTPAYLAAATASIPFLAPMGGANSMQLPAASVASSIGANQRLSRRNLIAYRRTALQHLAFSMLTAVPSRVLVAAGHSEIEDGEIHLLDGIGALVVDSERVDRTRIESTGQARVFDNVFVPLVLPEPASRGASHAVSAVDSPWHRSKINVDALWDQGLKGAGTLVGVLDTGIDSTHEEFSGKTIHFAEFDADGNQVFPVASRDAGDHGTHVSALIGGSTVGVAPAAELAVAAVLTTSDAHGRLGGTLIQIAAGLNWLVTEEFGRDEPGVHLVNASLGAGGYHDYLYATLANQGVPMVAAIGNNGHMGKDFHGSPGNYDLVIGVGATDSVDQIARFSDWGSVPQHEGLRKPDLVAPGVDVWSAVPGGQYRAMSGTSMASPIVAGCCALLLQQDPTLTVATLRRRIMSMVTPLPSARAGAGRLVL